jgi:large subunit ribosomal protein L21
LKGLSWKNRTKKVTSLTISTLRACLKKVRRYEMEAIFVTGGKQYLVTEGSVIYAEKIDAEIGKEVTFTDVLMVDGTFGTPYVDGAKVVCEVEKQGKNKKIVVFKFRPKKKYRNKQGHRQPYTKLIVKKIVK